MTTSANSRSAVRVAAPSNAATLSWHLTACALVLSAPAALWLRTAPWRLPPSDVAQVITAVACYLAVAFFAKGQPATASRHSFVRIVLASVAAYAFAYAVMMLWPEVARSAGVFGLSTALTAVLASRGLHSARVQNRLLAVIAVGALLLVGGATRDEIKRRAPVLISTRPLSSALAPLEVRYFSQLTGPRAGDGGGLAAFGEGFLLITGRGVLYRVVDSNGVLHSVRLRAASPLNRAEYLADQRDTSTALRLRVTHITIDSTSTPARVLVAHDYWNHAGRCFTLRVSSRALDSIDSPSSQSWRTDFESKPCLTMTPAFDDIETGGRFAWSGRSLLLSIGDHGWNGIMSDPYPQIATTDYGKVLRRDSVTMGWSVFTLGHRNPQGLFVDHLGTVWETEHGPQGGDEINVLVAGRNYGWPTVTYGTEYGRTFWPLNPTGHDHGQFAEPAYAFVPSIGISSIIEVKRGEFPEWTNDLLIGSLRTQSLWRVRHVGDHVIYVEPLRIGRRVRDIAQDAHGEIVIWTDEGDLVNVRKAAPTSSPDLAFAQCAGCHEPSIQGTALAPSLRGVVGRRVATEGGYSYSTALRQLGGTWTTDRLDAFIRNPAKFAPGTRMAFPGAADPKERQMILGYLARPAR